uniref:Disease resistance N-terminal domain-containing protein n=1 Tax=Ananas comosus var. bracteatus TaxID=296719 RepID=A0A6V7PF15_ANACO|nr:unnamed protein product [Ananas comosus var. bracteatus]
MEPILLAAAIGGFIIPFLNTLFAKYANFLQEKWIASEVVVADVKGISMTILKIQAVVSQAEARQAVHDHGLILWLRELKDAAYEADDLLDELNTTVLQLKEKKRQQRVSNSSADTISLGSKLVNRINTTRETLDRVVREWGNFKLGELDDKPGVTLRS